MRRLALRLLSFFRANRAETELAREIDTHLRLLEEQFIAQGTAKEILAVFGYMVLMMGVCLLACLVPTRRALRVEPTVALRTE